MEKKLWQDCQIEIIQFDVKDAIATSMSGDVEAEGDIFGVIVD